MKRFASIIRLAPEMQEKYMALHADPWDDVLKMIYDCNIRNYSIYLRDGILFSYFEYIGTDYAADMDKMKKDPTTTKWWAETDPCQIPILSAKNGEWWAEMQEVFHTD